MCSIKDGLLSVGLEKYQEAFESRGLHSVNDLTSCTPADLERLLNEIGMLKGHTFKMKKLVDEVKAGVEIKPRVAVAAAQAGQTSFKFASEPSLIQTKIDPSKFQDSGFKDQNERSKTELLSQELIASSLQEFLSVDLEVYHKVLCQLKHIQSSVRGLFEEPKSADI